MVRSMDRPTLARALDSIAAQIYRPTEIVVVAACGASHRALPAVWNNVPLRLISHDGRLDRATAANVALDAATGNWLNFLDDDDELLPDHLLQLVEALEPIPKCRLAYTRTIVVSEDGTTEDSFGWPHHRLRLLTYTQFHMMAALFHRSLLDDGVRFDESLPVCEDHDFWIQCAQYTEFKFVDKMTNRWHGFIGTSGAGMGSNNNAALVKETLSKIHLKWARLQQKWGNTLDGLLYRGRFAMEDGRSAEAKHLLGQALDLIPGNVNLLGIVELLFLGQYALKNDRPKDALPLLERALELAPDDINFLNLGGMANLQVGNLPRAKSLLLRALDIVPDHSGIQRNVRLVEHSLSKLGVMG